MTVGTLDGANVEIRERVGAENFFLFGMTEPEVSALYAKGYDTKGLSYEKDPQLKAAIDMVADGTFSDGDKDTYKDLVNDWLNKDYFMTLADFGAYMDIQAQIEALYAQPLEWNRMAVHQRGELRLLQLRSLHRGLPRAHLAHRSAQVIMKRS